MSVALLGRAMTEAEREFIEELLDDLRVKMAEAFNEGDAMLPMLI